MGKNVSKFYYQSSLMSSGRLISELDWNLLDDNGAGPKRVKTALPSEIGLKPKGIESFQYLVHNDVQYLQGALK